MPCAGLRKARADCNLLREGPRPKPTDRIALDPATSPFTMILSMRGLASTAAGIPGDPTESPLDNGGE